MTPLNFGPGVGADVTIVDDLVYLAFGGVTGDESWLDLIVLTFEGVVVRRQRIPDGFEDSFPRFGGRWMAYRMNAAGNYAAKALDVVSGEVHQFAGQAEGDYGLAVNDALGVVAYQWGNEAIWFGSLIDGTAHSSTLQGAADGIDEVIDLEHVTLRKDTRLSVPGIFWPVRRSDLTVGEWFTGSYLGLGVQVAGDVLRVALQGQNCPTPRCDTDGTHDVLVTGGPDGVRLLIGVRPDLLALTPVSTLVPPPPPLPIGPVSPPRSADGRFYDLLSFMLPDPALQPRIGPTHAINQIAGPNGMLYFVKFGNVATLETGRAYEMWAYDDNWIYQLEDASGSPPCSFSDPRMYPRHMQIGEQHAFKTGPHEAIFRQRDSHCEEIRRDPWDRKMWLEAVWDEFNWGPDLKIRATAMLVYDDTAQAEIQGRFVETGFYGAAGASGCRWRAYHAEGVYPNGPQHGAVFPDSAISSQSDFYLLGGPSPRADLTGCVAPVCPHLPALVVTPPAPPMPTPVPTPTPLPPAQPVGGSMRAYVKTAQFYTGINPTAQTKDLHGHPLTGDAQFPIYFNRPGQKNEGGGWETAELTPHDGGQFDVRYVDSNRQLSVDQFGAMTSRAAGAIGSDELFYATTQPDGSNLLYRFQNGVLVSTVLTLEAKQ